MVNSIISDKINAILLDDSNVIFSPLDDVKLKTADTLQKELSFSMINLYDKYLFDNLSILGKAIVYIDCSLYGNNNFLVELTRALVTRLSISKEVLLDEILTFIKVNPVFFNNYSSKINDFDSFASNYIQNKNRHFEQLEELIQEDFYRNQLYLFEKFWEKLFLSQNLNKGIFLIDNAQCLDEQNIKIINQLIYRIGKRGKFDNLFLYFKVNNGLDRWGLNHLDGSMLIKDQDYLNIQIYL